MLSKDEIIKLLLINKPKLKEKYGFNKIYLFGSVAKDKASSASDVDIAVDLEDEYKTAENYLGAVEDLSDILSLNVDLIYLSKHINPIIKKEIEKDKIIIE